MGIVERYILRGGFLAFAASLTVLTAIVWVSQALREVDLMTGKGQTILVFLSVTALTIPSLVSVIAPIALFAAVLYTLNKLNGDSELVVMSAAGMPPAQVARPFIILALGVAIIVGAMSTWAMPASYRQIRDVLSKVRADFLTYLVREGQFVTLDQGFVFHYRERGSGGALLGIFIQDRRDPEKISTYIAEAGVTIEFGRQQFPRPREGLRPPASRQRAHRPRSCSSKATRSISPSSPADRRPAPCARANAATLDLLRLTPANADLFARQYFGRFRAELHERLSAPLYVLAFAMIAFAALGQARTTRQGRSAAIIAAIGIVLALRVAGFAASNMSARNAGAVALVYALPLADIAGSLFYAFGQVPELGPPPFPPPASGTQPA